MKEKIYSLKPFDSNKYETIDLDRLVMYTVIQLEKLEVELSLENIIVGAFILFPKKFSMSGFPEYPDSTRVEKALWRCKGKKRLWIGGKTPHGYFVTDVTRNISSQIEIQLLSSVNIEHRAKATRLRRKENIIRATINSPAYKKYKDGLGSSISEQEFCHLLQATLDSSKETIKENLKSLKLISEDHDQKELLGFLIWLEHKFKYFINR